MYAPYFLFLLMASSVMSDIGEVYELKVGESRELSMHSSHKYHLSLQSDYPLNLVTSSGILGSNITNFDGDIKETSFLYIANAGCRNVAFVETLQDKGLSTNTVLTISGSIGLVFVFVILAISWYFPCTRRLCRCICCR